MTLDEAVGRVLARDVVSTNTLPVVRASSFDGIAVKSAAFADGLPDTSGWKLGVDYVRADTGDDFPDDFDAVVMIEKAAIRAGTDRWCLTTTCRSSREAACVLPAPP